MKEMPSEVQVGEWYHVEYTSDRDYVSSPQRIRSTDHDINLTRSQQVIDFKVMRWDDFGGTFSWATGEIVNHFIDIHAGHSLAAWKAPNVEKGCVE